MPTLSLVVHGPPLGKGAAVTSRTTGATYNPTSTANWMGAARMEIARQLPHDWPQLDVACWTFITAVFGRPNTGRNSFKKRRPHPNDERTRRPQKPDSDNISKIVLDSMTHAGVWRDDALADVSVRRFFAARGETPRVEILIIWGDELNRLLWPPDHMEDW